MGSLGSCRAPVRLPYKVYRPSIRLKVEGLILLGAFRA